MPTAYVWRRAIAGEADCPVVVPSEQVLSERSPTNNLFGQPQIDHASFSSDREPTGGDRHPAAIEAKAAAILEGCRFSVSTIRGLLINAISRSMVVDINFVGFDT